MNKFIVFFCASVIAWAPVYGQQSAKDAKIERLLTVMNIDKQMDAMFMQMKKMIASQMPSNVPADKKAKVEELQGKILDLVRSRMSWEKMRPQYIKLYSDTFTDQEIDGMVAFYDSPAGKGMLAKMPQVLSKSMALGQSAMAEIMPEVERLAKEAQAEK